MGLGSGKTWVGALKLILNHLSNGCPSLILGYNYKQVWGVQAQRIEATWREYFAKDFGPIEIWTSGNKAYNLPHIMIGQQPIICLSAENPKNLAGFEVGAIWCDEILRIKEGDNPTLEFFPNADARLRHTHAKVKQFIMTSTPEGSANFLWKKFVVDKAPNSKVWFCKTTDNRFLDQTDIDKIRSNISPELANQYLDGIALDYSANRAHSSFTEDNIIDNFVPNHAAPIYLGCDFNVAPMCWVVMQERDGKLYVFDEIVLTDNAQVDQAVVKGINKQLHKFPLTYVCPDASSNARSTVGPSQIQALMQTASKYGWNINSTKIATKNPPVEDRIANLGRLICNASKERQLFVTRTCDVLIHNLKNTNRLPNGSYDPGPKRTLGHILDALGYAAWTLNSKQPRAVGISGF